MKTTIWTFLGVVVLVTAGHAKDFNVATNGNDANPGTPTAPLRTIQRAADRAQPGDVITVHAGIYRERVDPPRGGSSDSRRIVYQAAPGEKVVITGSEIVKHWQPVRDNVWKVTLPNAFFGDFNPYTNVIHGDWFNPLGRPHHTGAVYLNGDWLNEAANLDEVQNPEANPPSWLAPAVPVYLLNVAWLRTSRDSGNGRRIPAAAFAAQHGIRTAPCSEGGQCIGWIENGDWVRYGHVDFGERTGRMTIRAASATDGGIIEIRLDTPDGKLLGTCPVPNTGGWQSWRSFNVKIQPASGVKSVCLVFRRLKADRSNTRQFNTQLWFARVNATNTTIWAQFKGVNPNQQRVEINARQTVFYPRKTGINYITVRGFTMEDAATQWAPPTAEQIGLIGPHWSRGWIIESNVIRYSMCCGISLGKYGDQWDNTSANTAEGYIKTIERALTNGWNRETIGHHIVRDNVISHCEQAGIVGSLGEAFSSISNNVIHDIHVRNWFSGAEMAGIKFHGAVDVQICHNHIYHTCLGLWLDWMAQGTHVSGNFFNDNGRDVFVEVDHGPFLFNNNLLLSPASLASRSQGGAYIHNLFAGTIEANHFDARQTPFLKAHSTAIAGFHNNPRGDDRYYNNLFVRRANLSQYDNAQLTVWMNGNVFLDGARPSKFEKNPLVETNFDPALRLFKKANGWRLQFKFEKAWTRERTRPLVTTALLGKAVIPGQPYEQPDGSPLRIITDYFGKPRNETNPTPGPFANPGNGLVTLKVW